MNVTDTGARNDCVTVLFIVMLLGLPGKGTHGGRGVCCRKNQLAGAGWLDISIQTQYGKNYDDNDFSFGR